MIIISVLENLPQLADFHFKTFVERWLSLSHYLEHPCNRIAIRLSLIGRHSHIALALQFCHPNWHISPVSWKPCRLHTWVLGVLIFQQIIGFRTSAFYECLCDRCMVLRILGSNSRGSALWNPWIRSSCFSTPSPWNMRIHSCYFQIRICDSSSFNLL